MRGLEMGERMIVVGGRYHQRAGVYLGVRPNGEVALRLDGIALALQIPAHLFDILVREPRPLWRKEPSAHAVRRLLRRINAPATRAERNKVRATVADATSFRHIAPFAREAAATTHAAYDQIDRSDPENWRPTSGSVAVWAACVRHNKRAAARRAAAV